MVNEVTSLLTMRGVAKRFGPTIALKDVSLDLAHGEVLALIGENGAGKSTLMKVLSGALTPDAGEMSLAGNLYRPGSPLAGREAGVAMIYQELSIAPHLTVMENILLGAEPGRFGMVSWAQMRAKAVAALAEVGRADIDPAQPAGNLTVAEQQLVEIARSVATGAKVLVFDEPTSSLTRRDISNLFAMIRRLRDSGLGIIYISHFLEEVREISTRYTVLRDGASVGSGRTADVSDAQVIRLMVGRDVADLYPRSEHRPQEVVLSASNLYGRSGRALDVSVELRRGEVFGLAGLIGAGRTDVLRAIFGLDEIKSGRLTVKTYVGPASPSRRWRQGVGLVTEDRKIEGLAVDLSIGDNIAMATAATGCALSLHSPRRQARAIAPLLAKLRVKCRSPYQNVEALSGGNQQKVSIGRLLHNDCDILLLDEPTRGVDIGAKAQIYALIDEAARAGRAILMVSSYLPELLGVCDRIAVMNRGVLGPARPRSEWDEHTLMAEAVGTEVAA